MSRTRIICTLGPASSKADVLLKMIRAGMDVARLNFSHGSPREHISRINTVRDICRKKKRCVKILGDLEGYRMRIGRLKGSKPMPLKAGQTLTLTQDDTPGSGSRVPFDHEGPLTNFKKGQKIYIDDGNIELTLVSKGSEYLKTRVSAAGTLKENKGINVPGLKIDFSGLTPQDKDDLELAAAHKVDIVAQSFVRSAADILAIREFLKGRAYRSLIIAKIENWDGIRNIASIMKVSDGIMVARGDMGVSIPIYEVPLVQKKIIDKCNRAGKMVITATQMLESMTENRRPTRAEVSDVANAILDGTDYVMLSGETSVGKYPVLCVDMMEKIIRFTEKFGWIA